MASSTPGTTDTGLSVCHSMKTTLIESYMDICKYEVRGRGQAGEGSSVEFINKRKDPEYSSSLGSKSAMAVSQPRRLSKYFRHKGFGEVSTTESRLSCLTASQYTINCPESFSNLCQNNQFAVSAPPGWPCSFPACFHAPPCLFPLVTPIPTAANTNLLTPGLWVVHQAERLLSTILFL